jgi:adenylate cyclase
MVSMEPGQPDDPERAARQAEQAARTQLNLGMTQRRLRRFWRILPTAPRCKMCNGPFGGPGGAVSRLLGKGRWPANPMYCRLCFKDLYRRRAGAEIECTLLFADIRGSTNLAETMHARDFRALLDRFYATASEVLVAHDAIVDKFVGDEVIGIFIQALTGELHARRGIDAGLALLRSTGNETDTPWVPIGIGVNSGLAYVGVVGTAEHVEFTALGDAVNITARLASAAGRGELLVTSSAARAAELADEGREHRRLGLKGKSEETDVVVLTLAGSDGVLGDLRPS